MLNLIVTVIRATNLPTACLICGAIAFGIGVALGYVEERAK